MFIILFLFYKLNFCNSVAKINSGEKNIFAKRIAILLSIFLYKEVVFFTKFFNKEFVKTTIKNQKKLNGTFKGPLLHLREFCQLKAL